VSFTSNPEESPFLNFFSEVDMATKKSAAKSSATALKGLTGTSKTDIAALAAKGRPVQVVGRVRNGVLEIDQASLEEFARKFPNANMTFVAVNAPFDPRPAA
jgi:hypothetical protein